MNCPIAFFEIVGNSPISSLLFSMAFFFRSFRVVAN
jgi:hypothetical protein